MPKEGGEWLKLAKSHNTIYYKVILMKTVIYWHNDIDQWNKKIGSPKIIQIIQPMDIWQGWKKLTGKK